MTHNRASRLRLLALVITIAVLGAACASDSPVDTGSPDTTEGTGQATTEAPEVDANDPSGRLAAARERWAENGPASYVMTTQLQCFCPEIEWKNTVIDGEVTNTVSTGEDQFIEPEAQRMEDLFDEVEEVIAQGFVRLDLEFDDETGALVTYWVDVEEMIVDEEHGVTVTVSPLDDSAVDADAIAGLVDDYGCGYGFAKSNEEQTLALVIFHTGGYSEEGPDLSSPIEFPNDAWSATVHTGSDLFANWCDDVMEEGEPVPVIDAEWTVVAGTLTAEVTDVASTVRGTLTAVTLESPSGDRVDVGDIDLINHDYGQFAG